MAASSADLVVLEGASTADRKNHYNWAVLSISPLCTRLSEVTELSVWASEPVLHILPSGRCTSLLWLNRLSRDPINHHLHSRPVRSPFTTATSSDMYTLLFTHALHALLHRHLPFIQHHLISQHTHSDILGLYSPGSTSGKTRQLLQPALPNSPSISLLIC